eukprot:m51a1_g12723 hypothetical protein (378) ;mRNA; r:146-3480
MVIWDKGAVVAVSFWSCSNVTLVGTRTPDKARRLTYKFKPKKAYWDYYDGTGAFAIRATGHNHTGVPPTWLCDKAKYNDGNCECNCGAGDVDCLRNFTWRAAEVDWEERGLCNASNYWQYDGCQCECGNTFDPDCWDVFTPVSVCAEALVNPFCSAPKMGQRSFCDAVWKCDSAEYEDGKICNCNCGAQDPDCYDHSLNTTCPGNWLCFEGKYLEIVQEADTRSDSTALDHFFVHDAPQAGDEICEGASDAVGVQGSRELEAQALRCALEYLVQQHPRFRHAIRGRLEELCEGPVSAAELPEGSHPKTVLLRLAVSDESGDSDEDDANDGDEGEESGDDDNDGDDGRVPVELDTVNDTLVANPELRCSPRAPRKARR